MGELFNVTEAPAKLGAKVVFESEEPVVARAVVVLAEATVEFAKAIVVLAKEMLALAKFEDASSATDI